MEPFGFQLIGEGKPFFKTPGAKNWYGTSLPWISIGYESKLNPLHTLALYNAVANNGRMMKPYHIQAISKGNQIEEEFGQEVIREKIASEQTIKKLRNLLEGVVIRGTAKNISNEEFGIAGKTGTAQKLINGRYTKKYYTSFAGYFPADRPKYSMIVVIDSPKGFLAYGGDVCAPVFKEIADRVYALDMELNPSSQGLISENTSENHPLPVIRAGKASEINGILTELGVPSQEGGAEDWVKTYAQENSVNWKANPMDENTIPDVSGLSLRDALFILENRGLKVDYSGKGRVKSQSIPAGTKLKPNSTIKLSLG